MTSTVNVVVDVTRTTRRATQRMLRGRSTLADVSTYKLSSASLQAGDSLVLDFEQLLFCTVNHPILIRFTTGENTVEFETNGSLVLRCAGRVELVNPPTNPIVLPVSVNYAVV